MSSHDSSLSGTVLLVDDDASTRAAFSAILTPLGYLVIGAHDGVAALEILQVALPDVVVTDVEMPSLSGVELCGAIRKSPSLQHLPVIAVSSAKFDEALQSRLFDVCLRKPVSPQELVVAISIFLKPQPIGNHEPDAVCSGDKQVHNVDGLRGSNSCLPAV